MRKEAGYAFVRSWHLHAGTEENRENAGQIIGIQDEIRAWDLLQNAEHALFGKTKNQEKRNIRKKERSREREQFVVGLLAILILEFVGVGHEIVVENVLFENT